jgi:ankyrin repeat protein
LIDVINMLLARDNSMVNLFDAEGKTALHHAAKNHDNVAIIKTLLASGADISIANYAGQTALALATAAGHECVLSLLQTKGVTYLKSPEIKATASPSAPPLDDLQDLPDSSADQQLAVSRKDINRAAFFQRPDANPLTPPPAANDHSGYQY